ncbi:M48 family metalloprotease [Pontibacter arcticus]|uniref:Membrane-binding protein n=1 Tax=Pontibacter arcticus TaxID=2080288 RepID=A0A364RBU6_9BACT|nr:membrane-binding protein [Pontibacter arcticus]RAU81749.1 membrane-binding protein [Pontibacter arcticus]
MRYLHKLPVILGLVLLPLLGQSAALSPKPSPATEVQGARDIVQEIIQVVGLKARFELRAADIENAAAVIYNGNRYILYNEDFLAAINNAVHTDWGGVSILAHEIGHHLNGHTLTRSGSNPADELEADEFSGFVLRKMGASLAEAQAAINLLSEERTSRTHPGRSYRMAAISKGWKDADSQLMASSQKPRPDQRAIASRPQPAQQQRQQPQVQRAVLTSQDVITRVYFTSAPNEQFYLTKKLQLVQVTNQGVKVLGKLSRTNNPDYPYYFESEYMQPLFISEKGTVVNKRGQRVGYFT